MLSRLKHSAKAPAAMEVILSGREMLRIRKHLAKAYLPMLVTGRGSVILLRSEHSLNALSPMVVSKSSNIIFPLELEITETPQCSVLGVMVMLPMLV